VLSALLPVRSALHLPHSLTSHSFAFSLTFSRTFCRSSSYLHDLASSAKWKKTMAAEKKAFSRLVKDVVPSNYALRLQPDLAAFTFDGHEDITVQVQYD